MDTPALLQLIADWEHINKPGVSVTELTEQERRALDRWFYLANMEYILIDNKQVSDGLGSEMIARMKSAATKGVFKERWDKTAKTLRSMPVSKSFSMTRLQGQPESSRSLLDCLRRRLSPVPNIVRACTS